MRKKLLTLSLGALLTFSACSELGLEIPPGNFEDQGDFVEIGAITLSGGEGAAEISTFDPVSKRLFVVNNAGTSRIDVVELQDPSLPAYFESIDISQFGGGINSLDVKNGVLAAAVEANTKQDDGKVVLFDANTLSLIKEVPVGALPDMLTYSPDGAYIITANEGEPNNDYSVDPIGTVSIISVSNGYSVKTLDFSSFNAQQAELEAKGFRVLAPMPALPRM